MLESTYETNFLNVLSLVTKNQLKAQGRNIVNFAPLFEKSKQNLIESLILLEKRKQNAIKSETLLVKSEENLIKYLILFEKSEQNIFNLTFLFIRLHMQNVVDCTVKTLNLLKKSQKSSKHLTILGANLSFVIFAFFYLFHVASFYFFSFYRRFTYHFSFYYIFLFLFC